MRYAIISDIHANVSALRRTLADAAAGGVERVICLGDVVGYGPSPEETIALLRQHAALTLCGNHDRAVATRRGAEGFIELAADAVRRHRAVLSARDLAWLGERPLTGRIEGALVAHGDFTAPALFNYVDSEEAASRNFAAVDAPLLFVGHTHEPCLFLTGKSGKVYRLPPQDFALEGGKRYIVNPGSVGYPRESGCVCRSSYVLYDSSARTIGFRFLPFEVASVLQRGGAIPHRRLLFAACGAALLLALVSGSLLFQARQQGAPPAGRSVDASEANAVLAERTLALRGGWRSVSANLKLKRKGIPATLRVTFRTASGEIAGVPYLTTVKTSSVKPIPIPPDADSAHFEILHTGFPPFPEISTFSPTGK